MRSLFLSAVITSVVAAGAANATSIAGSSSGSFSSPTGCSSYGGYGDVCGRNNTGSGATAVSNGQLYWGSTSSNNVRDPSTLTGGYTTISTSTPSNNTVIGSLTWFNSSTDSNRTPDTLHSTYTLAVSFTAPGGSTGDSQAFALTIDNTANPTGDNVLGGLTLTNLAGLSFNLPGVTVSDLHYVCASGCSSRNGATFTSSENSSNWFNPEGNTAVLQIVADFTATPTPEPMSLALLGTGLLGIGMTRLRARRA